MNPDGAPTDGPFSSPTTASAFTRGAAPMSPDTSQPQTARATGRISWRDTFSVWPGVRLAFEVAPWHWRLRFYRDGIEPCGYVTVGPLTFEWFANRDLFPIERIPEEQRP